MRNSMIIKNLKLENFKSHSYNSIDFSAGISIIMGENGAGKTSILEAISFALFKDYSARSLQKLVKCGQVKMKVVLEFITNSNTYRVTRERNNKTSRAFLELKDGDGYDKILTGDKSVTLEIEKLLEMDSKLFLNAVYVKQGEIADLIEKTPGEKKKFMGKLLGIESLEAAWKNMGPLISHYREKKEHLRGILASKKHYQDELKSKKAEKSGLKLKIREIEEKIQGILKDLEQLKNEKDKMDEKNIAFNDISSQIKSHHDFLSKLKKDQETLLLDLENLKKNEIKADELQQVIDSLDFLVPLHDLGLNLKELKREEEQLTKDLKKIHFYNDILSQYQIYREEYLDIDKKIQALMDDKLEFEGTKALIKSVEARKTDLKNNIQVLNQEIEAKITTYNQIMDTSLDSLAEIQAQFKKMSKDTLKKRDILEEDINKLNSKISSLKNQTQELENPLEELKQVEDKCPVCQSSIDKTKKENLEKNYSHKIRKNEEKIKTLKDTLKHLSKQKKVLNQKEQTLQKINLDILQEKIKTLQKQDQELEKCEIEGEKLKSKAFKLEEIESNIHSKKSRLKEIQDKNEEYLKAKHALETFEDPEAMKSRLNYILEEIKICHQKIDKLAPQAEPEHLKIVDDSWQVNLKKIEADLQELEKQKAELNKLQGIISQKSSLIQKLDQTQEEIHKTGNHLDSLENKLEELHYDKSYHEQLIEDFDNKNETFLNCNGLKKENEGSLNIINRSIKDTEKELQSLEKYESEMVDMDDFLKLLNYIRDLYGKDGVQKDLRNISRPLIEQHSRAFFDQFNFPYSDISIDEDYNVEIYGPGGKTSLDMVSGGEKISVALAMRLGITKVLSGGKLELIMLDEPTIHLDDYRRQELIDILKKMSILPQMIIVTHDLNLEEAADNIIKVKKDEGESQVITDKVLSDLKLTS